MAKITYQLRDRKNKWIDFNMELFKEVMECYEY